MRKSRILVGVAAVLVAGALVALVDARLVDERAARPETGVGVSSGLSQSYANDNGAVAESKDGARDLAAGGGVAAQAPAATPTGPRVVKTAALTVSVVDAASVTKATQKANTIAERHGGFIASTSTQAGEHASSTLTLRVPVAAYDAALGELRGLGEVDNERLGGEDVSATLVDLDARLRSLRAQESALNALMGKATTVGETLQVAQAVAEVRTQIEQLAAQQKSLADQADFATITVELVGPNGALGKAPSSDPVLVEALRRAAGGALSVLGGVILVVGYTLPAVAMAAAAYALWRIARRRVVTA